MSIPSLLLWPSNQPVSVERNGFRCLATTMVSTVATDTVDQQAAMIEHLIGTPTGHWIANTWMPTKGTQFYTTDELRHVFGKECTLFVGDSLQRRAADTLHLLLSTPTASSKHDVKASTFTDEYFFSKKHDRGFRQRTIPVGNGESVANATTKRLGCLDTDWRPLLSNVQEFIADYQNETSVQDYSEYTVIVIGSTIWDVVGSSRRRTSANELRQLVNQTIDMLATIPDHVKIVWKSSGWCHNCGWTPDNGRLNRGDNYKIYAANEQANKTLAEWNTSSNDTRAHYIDWAREVLPRSLGDDRILSGDNNPYHYGLEPRLQFLQMLAKVYDTWQLAHHADNTASKLDSSWNTTLPCKQQLDGLPLAGNGLSPSEVVGPSQFMMPLVLAGAVFATLLSRRKLSRHYNSA